MSSLAVKIQDTFTYADYMSWDDGKRWELIDGVAYNMSPAPRRVHQDVLGVLHALLFQFLKGKPCKVYFAPTDVRFPDYPDQRNADIKNVVQPDLLVVCDEEKLDERGVRGAPDLVVEVVSQYTSQKDLTKKFRLYERYGVREYWIVHPEEQTLQLFKWSTQTQAYGRPDMFCREDSVTVSEVLAGLELDLKEVFPTPIPMPEDAPGVTRL